ncbi:radical SAM domain protein [Leptospira ryugenii]|uniref:Radical SAM domain protein n=1 Tax=Leptospira ryugenii TaxID=1917863 RepID=A0A2P2DW10_9LEPT|nr:radical SAM protein [Leptospira ryugenii]GBF48821.1 radical SAM domain protein [Leptospira ryugenii]
MAKILLINPIIREEDKPKHIPYGLSLMAAIAMEKGHEVQFYDANAWRLGYDVIEEVATADDWDVIGIGGLTTAYSSIKKIVGICKKVSPKSFIIAGGGFITSMPLDIMNWLKEIDLGVIGEAFLTWPEILEKIDRKDFDFSECLGVCYRDEEGNPVLTDVRPNIADLDILPYPAWDLLPMEIYFENSQLLYSESAYLAKRRIDVNGSLGCSLVCKYCWHLGIIGDMTVEKNENGVKDVRFSYGRNIRYHSPRYIVDMVKTLVEKYNIDFVSFIDENMMTMDAASGRKWLFELCDLWIAEGLQPTSRRDGVPDSENKGGVFWGGTSHATLHTEEVLKAMFKAGCSHLVYGIESFDPTILKNLGKGSTQKNNLEAVPKCLSTGIIPLPNIIIGFPEESFDSIRTTIECMIKIGMYSRPHFATPYPGSEWYYTYKNAILEQYNGDLEAYIEDLGDASKITAVISHNFSPVELLGLQEIVAKRDLRLLEHTIAYYESIGRVKMAPENPYVLPNATFNIIKKKVTTPISEVVSI